MFNPLMGALTGMGGNQMHMMLQPLAVPLVVTEQIYMTQQQVSLLLSEQVLGLSGDDFKITDAYTGQLWFQINGKAFSFRDKKTLLNVYGQAICNLRDKMISIPPKQEIYAGDSSDKLICQIKKQFSLFQTKLSIPVVNLTNGQEITIYLKGDWIEKRAQIMLGDKHGPVIATISRQISLKEIFFKKQDYIATIAPGVDAALIVMICVALDEFTREG